MAEIGLLSTLLMGAFLVVIGVGVSRLRNWRGYVAGAGEEGVPGTVSRLAGHPAVWVVAFVLLAVGLGLGAVAFVGGLATPASLQGTVGLVIGLVTAVVLGAYLLFGVYRSARHRGRPSSLAAAEGLGLLAILFVVVIVAKLVVAA